MKQQKRSILLVFLVTACILCSCYYAKYLPEEGAWYCEELQIQLSFDSGGDCFIVVDGQKIKCGCGADRGSDWLTVGCQKANTEHFYLGEEVFGGRVIELTENKLVVFEPGSGKEFTFVRVA